MQVLGQLTEGQEAHCNLNVPAEGEECTQGRVLCATDAGWQLREDLCPSPVLVEGRFHTCGQSEVVWSLQIQMCPAS